MTSDKMHSIYQCSRQSSSTDNGTTTQYQQDCDIDETLTRTVNPASDILSLKVLVLTDRRSINSEELVINSIAYTRSTFTAISGKSLHNFTYTADNISTT